MRVKRLNSVQKATNLKEKSKVGMNQKVQYLLKQLQTSDHRFRGISALISATSPEKMDRYTKLRNTLGTMNIHQQRSPFDDHKCSGDPSS